MRYANGSNYAKCLIDDDEYCYLRALHYVCHLTLNCIKLIALIQTNTIVSLFSIGNEELLENRGVGFSLKHLQGGNYINWYCC